MRGMAENGRYSCLSSIGRSLLPRAERMHREGLSWRQMVRELKISYTALYTWRKLGQRRQERAVGKMGEGMERSLLVLLVLLFLMTAPALGQDECHEAGLGEADGTFVRWVRFVDSWTLDPVMATDAASTEVLVKLYDTLVQFKAGTTEIEAGLAESWEISPDGTQYTFHLRDGVVFHDGAEMTARDVKYSIDRLMDPATASPRARLAEGIARVSVIDEDTVEIEMLHASGSLLPRLAYVCFSIIPGEGFDPEDPVGTGPYRLVERASGGDVVLEAFDGYWGGSPLVERYLLHPEDDREAIWQAFRDRVVSLTEVPSTHWAEYVDEYLQDPGMGNYTAIVPQLVTYWLIFNCQEWPFKEKAIRNAVCCALRKEEVLEEIFTGRHIEARGPLPPGLLGFDQTLYDSYPYTYNPEKARLLLDNAGIIDSDGDGIREYEGRPLTVEYSSYIDTTWERAYQMHVEDLRAVGIETTYRQHEFATLVEKMGSANFTMMTLGWGVDYSDAENFMILWESGNIPDPNSAHYSNPIFDDLAERARREIDLEERLRLYEELSSILMEDNPHWWFFHPRTVYVWQDSVPGIRIGPLGFLYEKMVATSCSLLHPEIAAQLEEMFAEAREHIGKAREAEMDTEQMETYLSVAEDFWKDCDHVMAQTYLEGILQVKIPQTALIPILSILGVALLPLSQATGARQCSDQASGVFEPGLGRRGR